MEPDRTRAAMFGSVDEKTTNDERSNNQIAVPVAVSQKLDFVILRVVLPGTLVDPVIVVPSDEKEREWWDDPVNQLDFVWTKMC